jgi:GST-like protein
MIDLHFINSPNGFKISIMLEEVGLDYRRILYDIVNGDHLTPQFHAINPNHKLPALIDHDPIGGGEPLAVFETGAMLVYLAEKTGKFLPTEPRARTHTMQWLMWQMAGLGPMHGQAVHFIRIAPPGNDYSYNRYTKEAFRLLDVLETRLANAEYLAGDEYTIADMASWPWVRLAKLMPGYQEDRPNLKRWFDAIAARPGVIAGGTIPSDSYQAGKTMTRLTLTPQQWSNIVGERMWDAAKGV